MGGIMKNITFADIEGEIKKIPVDKLPEVYYIIREYSQKSSRNTKSHSIEKTNMADALQELSGCIKIEDLNDYANIKGLKKPFVTDYASTVDQDLSIACVNEPSQYEE